MSEPTPPPPNPNLDIPFPAPSDEYLYSWVDPHLTARGVIRRDDVRALVPANGALDLYDGNGNYVGNIPIFGVMARSLAGVDVMVARFADVAGRRDWLDDPINQANWLGPRPAPPQE